MMPRTMRCLSRGVLTLTGFLCLLNLCFLSGCAKPGLRVFAPPLAFHLLRVEERKRLLGEPNLYEELIDELISSEDQEMRQRVYLSLQRTNDAARLSRVWEREKNKFARRALARAIGVVGGKVLVPALLEAASSKSTFDNTNILATFLT
ncbi:MAG: hypothetical protein AAF517_02405, partial [Planctomycetota bacterium]